MGLKQNPELTSPITELTGVGNTIENKLARLGIHSVQDLLFHLPYRYIDRTRLSPIGALQPGNDALVQGVIELTQVQFGKRRSLLCRISDGTGGLVLRFFHFSKSQQAKLIRGNWLRCWGQPRRGIRSMEMIHPEYQHISEAALQHLDKTLTPVYPLTEGISQGKLRKLTDQALHILAREMSVLEELLPKKILAEISLPALADALQYVHRPPPDADVEILKQGRHPAQQRLVFEELLAHHLSLRSQRKRVHTYLAPHLENSNLSILDTFIKKLPFTLTRAQQKVINEIQADIAKGIPMLRLIQGDVGSGKTIVAAVAALQVIDSGFQVAFMAPTELLADQHRNNMCQWLDGFNIPVVSLSGKQKRPERKRILEMLGSDRPLIAIGTHALFQEEVHFNRLGMVIIDEQHRFGVHQRLSLLAKGAGNGIFPHQLIMTATPIPRTLAMTVFADLDISIIDELPPGRQITTTAVLSNEKRQELVDRIERLCKSGRQVYWVCTLIEESDTVAYQAAIDTCEYISSVLPDLNVALVHGRMKSTEKEEIMRDFTLGKINLLVATTVIEVGVDVPNASLMVIENAERLGLSQLHQLRGRVGRGNQQSDCVLLYQPPLTDLARARLETMRKTTDGFIIARKDLELRGPGDMLGTRQTGLPEYHIADLIRDACLLPQVQKVAEILLSEYPDSVKSLTGRWLTKPLELGTV